MDGDLCLPLRAIGGALAVCSHQGELLGATAAAEQLFARLGIGAERLPESLWRPLSGGDAGMALEWRPHAGAVGTLGCTRYTLGGDRHLLVMREISQFQQAESQRLQLHRVEAAARLVGQVAHDLRAPLATLMLTMDVLRSSWSQLAPDEIDQSLGSGWHAIEQLTQTVDALLEFARIGTPSHGSIALAEVFDRVGAMLRPVLRDGRHRLVVQLDERAARVRGNSVAIEQIFVNLVLNAAEASASPVEIRIDSRPMVLADDDGATREMVRVRVADDGPGVAPEVRPRLFQGRFSTKGGAGIGLCLARDAAVGCGGRIELEDAERGACFAVLLPVGGPA